MTSDRMQPSPVLTPPDVRLPGKLAEKLGAVACLAAVLVIGAVARLWHWREVLRENGVSLTFDSDPKYHVLQAERFLHAGLGALWFDRTLNWPVGAVVPWPPLFDVLVAAAARVAFGPAPARDQIAAAAAVLPVVLALATLLVVAGLGRILLGQRGGTGAALVLALLAAHVVTSAIGRGDQHVLEVLLSTAILLAFVMGWRGATALNRGIATAALGLLVALSFWNWMGSALNLVLPVAYTAAAYVFLDDASPESRRVPRILAAGLAIAAVTLAISIAALGPPGALARGSLLGVTGLHVALTAVGAAFGAVLAALARTRARPPAPARRIFEVAAAGLVPFVAMLVLFPGMRAGVSSGITALGASNPWYASILEFQHLLFSCDFPLAGDVAVALIFFGLAIPASILAAPALAARWKQGERHEALFLACWGALYLALVLARRRFAPYAAVPFALLAWEAVRFWSRAATRRLRLGPIAGAVLVAVGVALVVAPSARAIPGLFKVAPARNVESALTWLRAQPAPDDREGVLSSWSLGHDIAYFAGKPVIATPFGTEGGEGALVDTARFAFERDPSAAEQMLLRRRVGFVVLTDPGVDAYVYGALAAPGNEIALTSCNFQEGVVRSYAPTYADLMFPRLFQFDGLSAPDRPSSPLPWTRLLYESGRGTRIKIFGIVPGARVRVTGASPNQPLTAAVTLVTNQGRRLEWSTSAVTDESGTGEFRLPYSSGGNGEVVAGPWRVADGDRTVQVNVSNAVVVAGGTVEVRWSRRDGVRPVRR